MYSCSIESDSWIHICRRLPVYSVLLEKELLLVTPALMNFAESVRLLRHARLCVRAGFRKSGAQLRIVFRRVVLQRASFVVRQVGQCGRCAVRVVSVLCGGVRGHPVRARAIARNARVIASNETQDQRRLPGASVEFKFILHN